MPTQSSFNNPPHPPGLVFDDAPLDAILYGDPGGPSSADIFVAHAELRAAIRQAWLEGRTTDALRQTHELLSNDLALTEGDILITLGKITFMIPDCGWPILPAGAFRYETVLEPIFGRAVRAGRYALAQKSGLLLARAFEARDRFADSAAVFATLLTYARLRRNRVEIAQNTNNLGYTLTLQGRCAEAERYCDEAVAGFTAVEAQSRANNARANLLTARMALDGFPDALALESEIMAVDQRYPQNGDWRRRKTLVLLAKIREHLGDLPAALDLVDLALVLTRGIRTLHRREDARYRRDLMGVLKRRLGVCEEGARTLGEGDRTVGSFGGTP